MRLMRHGNEASRIEIILFSSMCTQHTLNSGTGPLWSAVYLFNGVLGRVISTSIITNYWTRRVPLWDV